MAIIARISESDAIEAIKLESKEVKQSPTIAKIKSVIDQDWSEQLVGQALDEMFRIF